MENFWPQSIENSSTSSFPQPLARQAWGRCPAVSMKTVYSALAAWHPVRFSVWVVSRTSPGTHRAVGARLIGWRPELAKSPLRHCAGFYRGGGAIYQPPAPWYSGRCWSANAYLSGDQWRAEGVPEVRRPRAFRRGHPTREFSGKSVDKS